MVLAKLDPRTALVLVDLQKGVVSNPGVHLMSCIVKNAAALADAFRRRSLPVVLVHAVGTAPGRTEQALSHGQRPADWTELVPELNWQPTDHVVAKRTWGAFTNTGLDLPLRGAGVTQVVIAGLVTSIGVESTARQAYDLGFNVTLAVDAMTDRNADAHHNSVERIFPKLGETGTVWEIINALRSGDVR